MALPETALLFGCFLGNADSLLGLVLIKLENDLRAIEIMAGELLSLSTQTLEREAGRSLGWLTVYIDRQTDRSSPMNMLGNHS